MSVVDDCAAAIDACTDMVGVLEQVKVSLADRMAKEESGLRLTPMEMVEELRKHARQRVLDRQEVVFWNNGHHLAQDYCGEWRLTVHYPSGTNFEKKSSEAELLNLIDGATMFPANT